MQPGKYPTSSGLTNVLVHLCQHPTTLENTVHEALGLEPQSCLIGERENKRKEGEKEKERCKERGRKEFRGGSRAGRKQERVHNEDGGSMAEGLEEWLTRRGNESSLD